MLKRRSFWLSLFCLAVLGALFSGAALAAAQTNADPDVATPKGKWDVQMVPGPKGDFGYCLMRAPYSNGLTLAIALSPKQEINVGVQVPNADFTKDEKHPLNVSIDKLFSKDRVAIAIEKELLLAPMQADASFSTALRKGRVLTLTGPEDKTSFLLKNTKTAMVSLKQCVDVGTGKAKPPQALKGKGAKGVGSEKADFPPGLLQLLHDAGLKDLELARVKDPSKTSVDFAWRTAGLFGGMRERKVPPDVTVEKMTDVISGSYKQQCNGMFVVNSSDIENYKGVKLRTLDVGCQMQGRSAYVALLIYLTDTHLFTMFMHEGDLEHKENVNKARDGIAGVIRKVAKEEPGKQ